MIHQSIELDSPDMLNNKMSMTPMALPMTPSTTTQSPLELRSKSDGFADDDFEDELKFKDDVLYSDGSSSPPTEGQLSPASAELLRAANLNPVQHYFLTSMQGQVDLFVRLLLSACASLRAQHASIDAQLAEHYRKEDGPRYRRCAPHNHAGRSSSTLVRYVDTGESEIFTRVNGLLDQTKKAEKERDRYAHENGVHVDLKTGRWGTELNDALVEVAGGVHWWCRETH